jgi:biotin transporter BioY
MRMTGYLPPLVVIVVAVVVGILLKVHERRHQRRTAAAIIALVICVMVVLELGMGRLLTYQSGPIRLWVGNVQSNQNSQQIADPYTLTHVIHGAAFYGLTRLALGASPVALRALVALTLEAAWEALENTDMVISRYRSATVSLGYYGDSVINSVADVLACLIGFLLAWRLPRSATITWVVLVEVGLALWIRDNLTLNILMLIHPVRVIRQWQLGA